MEERSDPEDWGTRLEEEMRPLGETLGGALGGLVQGLVGGLGGAPFHQAVVDRRDGEEVVTGDHTMVSNILIHILHLLRAWRPSSRILAMIWGTLWVTLDHLPFLHRPHFHHPFLPPPPSRPPTWGTWEAWTHLTHSACLG